MPFTIFEAGRRNKEEMQEKSPAIVSGVVIDDDDGLRREGIRDVLADALALEAVIGDRPVEHLATGDDLGKLRVRRRSALPR